MSDLGRPFVRPSLNGIQSFSAESLHSFKELKFEQRTVYEQAAHLRYLTRFRMEQIGACKHALALQAYNLQSEHHRSLAQQISRKQQYIEQLLEQRQRNQHEMTRYEAEICRLTQISRDGAIIPRQDFQVQTYPSGNDAGISIRRAQSITTMCYGMQDFGQRLAASFAKRFPGICGEGSAQGTINRQESMPSVFRKTQLGQDAEDPVKCEHSGLADVALASDSEKQVTVDYM